MTYYPTFNNYSLQSDNVITKTIESKTRSKRNIEAESVSRSIGKKLINTQLQEKVIQLSGVIIGDDADDLQSKVDEFQLELSEIEKPLIISGSRAYTATAERIVMPDRQYTQTLQSFEVQFVCAEGYAEDNQQTATTLLISGTNTFIVTTTISGTVLNRPLFRYVTPSGNGQRVNTIVFTNNATGNALTVSGVWTSQNTIAMDFDTFKVTKDGTEIDYVGAMEDIAVGNNSFSITVSGNNSGSKLDIEYNPRYW